MSVNKESTRDLPHLIIKKVAKESQGKMEEYVRQFGNVGQIYYSKTGCYPYMFVAFTEERSLHRAYVDIAENHKLYEVSLAVETSSNQPSYCSECMRECGRFCEACSAPYCSTACQQKHWPIHYQTCAKIPNLVNVQWHRTEKTGLDTVKPIEVNDLVVIVGYRPTTMDVTLRSTQDVTQNANFNRFLYKCNEEAARAPPLVTLSTDAKVLAQVNDQWYRGIVKEYKGSDATVELIDLGTVSTYAMSTLKRLESRDIFFEAQFTFKYRMKGLKSDLKIFESSVAKSHMEKVIREQEVFVVTELLHDTYVDLQVPNTTNSLNRKLKYLCERNMGISDAKPLLTPINQKSEVKEQPPTANTTDTVASQEPNVIVPVVSPTVAPTVANKQVSPTKPSLPVEPKIMMKKKKEVKRYTHENIRYPAYEESLENIKIFICACRRDITWTILGLQRRYKSAIASLDEKVCQVGRDLFSNNDAAPNDLEEIDFNDLCVVRDSDQVHRCRYLGEGQFEGLDSGELINAKSVDQIRFLPGDLLDECYLMECTLEEADDDPELERLINSGLPKMALTFRTVDELIHVQRNVFIIKWKSIKEDLLKL